MSKKLSSEDKDRLLAQMRDLADNSPQEFMRTYFTQLHAEMSRHWRLRLVDGGKDVAA